MVRIGRYRRRARFSGRQGCFVSLRPSALRDGFIRHLVAQAVAAGALRAAAEGPATWLSELVWRDFYFMILDRFPHVTQHAFKPEYDAIVWEQGPRSSLLLPGARGALVTRWSMPQCVRSIKAVTCITGCACWWRPSWA